MIDFEALSDADLSWVADEVEHERLVRHYMRPLRCGVIWGPGPPYYGTYCKFSEGHVGEHVPKFTKEEARDRYYASSRVSSERYAKAREEAVRRIQQFVGGNQ